MWSSQILFEGSEASVRWQVDRLESELADAKIGMGLFESQAVNDESRNLAEQYLMNPWKMLAIGRLRLTCRASLTGELCIRAIDLGYGSMITAYSGEIQFYLIGEQYHNLSETSNAIARLGESCASSAVNVVVDRCPPDWKSKLPIWGRPPTDLALQKAVKRALDPQNLFNPGRFVTDAF
jgi:glycolate oxidase FAD binding subunit